MSDVKSWSTTAATNNAAPPDGFPENMAPSTVNNAASEVMAAIRRYYESPEFRDWGHTPSYVNATSFTVTGDQTSVYVANRPIRCTDSTTLYGTIVSSSFSTNTTVTVLLDSGSLSASLTSVALGPTPATQSIHFNSIRGFSPSVLISTVTASAATTVDFTSINNSLYGSYVLVGDNIIPGTNTVQLLMRFSVAGVFDSGATSYVHHAWRWTSAGSGTGGSTGDTAIQIISSESLGTGANQFASFNATIFNPKNSAHKQVTWSATGLFASGSYVGFQGGGRFKNSTSDIDGIRILASSGTISGTFSLYGLRK